MESFKGKTVWEFTEWVSPTRRLFATNRRKEYNETEWPAGCKPILAQAIYHYNPPTSSGMGPTPDQLLFDSAQFRELCREIEAAGHTTRVLPHRMVPKLEDAKWRLYNYVLPHKS